MRKEGELSSTAAALREKYENSCKDMGIKVHTCIINKYHYGMVHISCNTIYLPLGGRVLIEKPIYFIINVCTRNARGLH